ncbi:MAG: aspartate aminotransferase family protein [Nitrososphaerota archaeon]
MSLRDKWASRYLELTRRSEALFRRASQSIPGGVNYPLRYLAPHPLYASRAEGCYVWDIDGNRYVDYWMGHFALIMGHAYRKVIDAAKEQLEVGAHFGLEHEWEVMLAEQIKKMVRSVELVRFANSGTEANMYAVRAVRTYTGRKEIGKLEGCWHGGYDGLHKAVSYPFDAASSAGLPEEVTGLTVVLPFNDIEGATKIIRSRRLAAVFVELVPSQGAFNPADTEYVKALREACDETGTLLVFDEVITGFRLSPGGAQEIYRIYPDLTVFGKILGGGFMPMGAFGGRSEVMERLDQTKFTKPSERSFHGGTYAGNPLAARCGYTLLKELESGEVQERLNGLGEYARRRLREAVERSGLQAYVTGIGSLIGLQFMSTPPRSPRDTLSKMDRELAEALYYYMLINGVYYISPHVPHFGLSAPHREEHIDNLATLLEEFGDEVRREKRH